MTNAFLVDTFHQHTNSTAVQKYPITHTLESNVIEVELNYGWVLRNAKIIIMYTGVREIFCCQNFIMPILHPCT